MEKDVENGKKRLSIVRTLPGFLSENKLMVVSTIVLVLFIYWIKLANHSIGVDTNVFLHNNPNYLGNDTTGRWGAVFVMWLIHKYFSITGANFVGIVFLIFASFLWCNFYDRLLIVYGKNIVLENSRIESEFNKKKGLYLCFSLLYVSSSVWLEYIYFTGMVIQVMLGSLLCPIISALVIELLMKAENSKSYRIWKTVAVIALSVFVTSLYQSLVFLFFAGMLSGLLILFEEGAIGGELSTDNQSELSQSGTESLNEPERYILGRKETNKVYMSAIGIAVISIVAYYLSDFILCIIFGSSYSGIGRNRVSGGYTIQRYIAGTGFYALRLLFNNFSIFRRLVHVIVVSVANNEAPIVDRLFRVSDFPSCALYIIAIPIFIIAVLKKNRKKIRSIWYILTGIGILLMPMVFPVLYAGNVPIRVQMPLTIVGAFVVTYMFREIKRRSVSCILAICCGIFVIGQADKLAAINLTDQIRYEKDVNLAYEVSDAINKAEMDSGYIKEKNDWDKLENAKIFFTGTTKYYYDEYAVFGEISGESIFDWPIYYITAFMNDLGLNFQPVEEEDPMIDKLEDISEDMPCWPEEGSVITVNNGSYVIVKFGDDGLWGER